MDETIAATMQNTQMLREIRDEIRTSRNVTLGAAGVVTTGNTGLVAKAQAASDRVLAADWASLGWSNAYSSQIRNNLFADIGAVTGFSRAPSTLSQSEYEGLARENLFTLRPHNLVAGIIAPGYSARVNSLADTIFANSPRFARFGASDSPLGVGLTRTGAYGLAKAIQGEAFTNMRLSGADISQIAATGLQTGQFDTTSASDFMGKLRELAAATADVTRSLRMNVTEAAQAMGGLRNIGVTGVGEQRNVLMGMGAAAQVAGLTTGEMLAGGFNAASTGVGLGLGGGQSMLGFARNAAQMRALTQAGAVSEYTMARGGGATGVASTIFNAEAQFATSDAGYFSYIGRQRGKTGGFFDELSGGVSEVAGGGFFGGLRSQRRRADITSKMSDEDRKAGLRNFITQQIEMFGIRDVYSEEAQDMAFNLAKNMGMDEAAAQVYTTANFSREGAFASDRSRLLQARNRKLQERKLAEDESFTYTSWPGKFARARGLVGKTWAGIAESTANIFTAGQTGFFGTGWGANLSQQRQDVLDGNVSHNADITAMVKAGDETLMADSINLYSSSWSGKGGVTGNILGSVGGGYLGYLGGAWAGAKLGTALGIAGGVPGMVVGAIGGTVLGLGMGFLGETIGTALSTGVDTTSLHGAQARNYLDVARAMRGNNSINAGKDVLKTGKLSQSATFRMLTSGTMTRGDMDVTQSAKFAEDVGNVVKETGLSSSEVIAGLKAAGLEGNMASAFAGMQGNGPSAELESDLRNVVGNASNVNFMLSENAAALREFSLAAEGRDSSEASIHSRYVNAVAGLKSAGVSSEGIESVYKNIRRMDAGRRGEFEGRLSGAATYGASRQMRDFTSGVLGYAEDLVGTASESERDVLNKELKGIREKVQSGGKASEVLNTLMSGNTELGAFLSRKSKLIGSISGLTAEDLGTKSAEELAAKFGLGKDVFAAVQKQVNEGTYTKEQGVTDIRMRALQQEVKAADGEDMSTETRELIRTFVATRNAMVEAKNAMERIAK